MKIHEFYIKRCIEIAKNGLGSTRPNPMVGCVIVANESIIAEGFTSPYGGPHAEANAINAIRDKSLLKSATLYVTLEPCSHFGKTPPCSDLIIKYQIPNVVIGCVDDNSLVAGTGITSLKNKGVNVTVGVLEDECRLHHKRFFTFHNKKRPYIILKWAETLNGFIAPEKREETKPVWITNKTSRQLVHKWRTEEQAILVGTNTVVQDNPALTARNWKGNNPIRIVIDRYNTLDNSLNVFNHQASTLIIDEQSADFKKPLAPQICSILHKNNINSVIVEGGAKTLQTFIDGDLWDEARVFNGNQTFKSGTKAPRFFGKHIGTKKILEDTLNIYVND